MLESILFDYTKLVSAFESSFLFITSKKVDALKAENLKKIQTAADIKIEEAKSTSEIASKEAAGANERAAEANLLSAKVEKENIELRVKFSNRHIDQAQYRVMIDELAKHKATINIEHFGDAEAIFYRDDIVKTLTDAGWKIGKTEWPLAEVWTGLVIFQTNDPSALVLADALTSAGIPFSIGDRKRDITTLMIGRKPPIVFKR